MHDDPLGYFLTWVTYGAWLPGDSRGWIKYRGGWQVPDPIHELESNARMTEDACILTRAFSRPNSEKPSKHRSPRRAGSAAGH